MEQAGEFLLELRNIVKVFPGVRALDGVSLRIRAGRVHVICGENGAGKSTLMKVINGTYAADEGEMLFRGKPVGRHTVYDTISMGIAMIYQELNPIREMTIAENIFLGREPVRRGFVDYDTLYGDTQALLDRLHMPFQARQRMKELSIAGQQLVEIAHAISMNASLIIMDEPTSAIAETEAEVLFRQIAALREQGVAIIYITHKMDELFRIADEITIIRDGKWVETGPVGAYDVNKVISRMVGREITEIFPKDTAVPIGPTLFEARRLTQSKKDGGRFRDVSFSVRAGEILGFSGLVGAGRSEVMRAIFGLDPLSEGEILLEGKPLAIRHTSDAIRAGVAMINEDRKGYGLVLGRDIHDNIALVNLDRFTRAGMWVSDKEIDRAAEEMIELLRIKVPHQRVQARTLSGGNQQKVVLAKWLIGKVKVMIFDEPTRGIDVGAKSEIHKLMCRFARQGMAIIMVSSELPEILGMSDRVAVMRDGRINGILDRAEATQERIMMLATKGADENECK
ncbi:sugar ABC transporter ATP-binding protein [Agathobaculum sp. NTUH-O15-33]|uniref:sugar ABC transporter ATP-binding protein n=1 Tax=Agathobaculum sp. NTUH-O15-33 TaxID=3079302 RepID=UPI0029587B59|nr:sugar ABC transporter ATP-binding protein [Agathobaculum sp. NTUH-O15-33]WNX85916.1 sugar ABC transporter ATP-binding protein [Agathobaculum sp. NTUH-O15-33]